MGRATFSRVWWGKHMHFLHHVGRGIPSTSALTSRSTTRCRSRFGQPRAICDTVTTANGHAAPGRRSASAPVRFPPSRGRSCPVASGPHSAGTCCRAAPTRGVAWPCCLSSRLSAALRRATVEHRGVGLCEPAVLDSTLYVSVGHECRGESGIQSSASPLRAGMREHFATMHAAPRRDPDDGAAGAIDHVAQTQNVFCHLGEKISHPTFASVR